MSFNEYKISFTIDWIQCIDCNESFEQTMRQSKVYNKKGGECTTVDKMVP